MANGLPQPIGVGRTAEVFPWGDGKVVKLLRPGFDPRDLADEAAKTAAAVASGAPAPAVYGLVEVAGRPGLVLERVEGTSMLGAAVAAPHRVWSFGSRLGTVHTQILSCHADLPPVTERLSRAVRRAALPDHLRDRALESIASLPQGGALLHGDLHPDNVFGSEDDPIVIDWTDASVGDPAADIARTLWLLSPDAIPPDQPRRRSAKMLVGFLRRSYARTVRSSLGLTGDQIERWRFPILAARVAEGIDHERDPLLRALERPERPRGAP